MSRSSGGRSTTSRSPGSTFAGADRQTPADNHLFGQTVVAGHIGNIRSEQARESEFPTSARGRGRTPWFMFVMLIPLIILTSTRASVMPPPALRFCGAVGAARTDTGRSAALIRFPRASPGAECRSQGSDISQARRGIGVVSLFHPSESSGRLRQIPRIKADTDGHRMFIVNGVPQGGKTTGFGRRDSATRAHHHFDPE